ncbi:MAG: sugar phosphate isomerase/epimerase [Oscillospiraceae bacterium]|jgi:sugar phosphate isomerase/epimerase|nr:sugar phosphate isomerase/epimerase [Oscillospiraceae bacterium]
MISVQLYSLRDKTETDFPGVLEALGKLGYQGVEFAGYGGIPSSEMKSLLDQNGLVAAGSHVGFDLIRDNLDGVIAYNKTIDNKNIVIPWTKFENEDEFKEVAGVINAALPKLHENDFELYYHNHSHEFQKDSQGVYWLNRLFAACHGLLAELDVCWVKAAGLDPIQYIKEHTEIVKMLHLKNFCKSADGKIALLDIAQGEVDIAGIVAAARQLGIENFVVENDSPRGDSLEDVKVSLDYFKTLSTLN